MIAQTMWKSVAMLAFLIAATGGKHLIGHFCQQEAKVNITMEQPFKRNATIREFEWCIGVPPRCSKYYTKLIDDVKFVVEEKTILVNVCCSGYQEENNTCIPICNTCVHGNCIRPNVCVCDAGYVGTSCNTTCPTGFWGPTCTACNCQNAVTCDPKTGSCDCATGWTGLKCDLNIQTEQIPNKHISTTNKIATHEKISQPKPNTTTLQPLVITNINNSGIMNINGINDVHKNDVPLRDMPYSPKTMDDDSGFIRNLAGIFGINLILILAAAVVVVAYFRKALCFKEKSKNNNEEESRAVTMKKNFVAPLPGVPNCPSGAGVPNCASGISNCAYGAGGAVNTLGILGAIDYDTPMFQHPRTNIADTVLLHYVHSEQMYSKFYDNSFSDIKVEPYEIPKNPYCVSLAESNPEPIYDEIPSYLRPVVPDGTCDKCSKNQN